MNLTKYKIAFKDGKILETSAVKYELRNGLHLFYQNSPNLGKFVSEEIVLNVQELPKKEFAAMTPESIELD